MNSPINYAKLMHVAQGGGELRSVEARRVLGELPPFVQVIKQFAAVHVLHDETQVHGSGEGIAHFRQEGMLQRTQHSAFRVGVGDFLFLKKRDSVNTASCVTINTASQQKRNPEI